MSRSATQGSDARSGPIDTEGLDLTMRPGPVVWFEEHWAVKPDKLGEFLATYDKEVYALARRISGYRGYTINTTLPPDSSENEPDAIRQLSASETHPSFEGYRYFSRHRALHTDGIKTEWSINIGTLRGLTYNLTVIHHFATWTAYAKFKPAMAVLYAEEHDGKDLNERLSETLYRLVDNVWTEVSRMIDTAAYAQMSPYARLGKTGNDADGLDLEPHRGPLVMCEEYWDIAPEKARDFIDAYDNGVYPIIRQVRGVRGGTTVTSLPPFPGEASVPIELGMSDDFFMSCPGLLMAGEVRTDKSVNAGAMFRKTSNIKTYIYCDNWDDWKNFTSHKALLEIINATPEGKAQWNLRTNVMHPMVRSHWDYFTRIIKTSFVAA